MTDITTADGKAIKDSNPLPIKIVNKDRIDWATEKTLKDLVSKTNTNGQILLSAFKKYVERGDGGKKAVQEFEAALNLSTKAAKDAANASSAEAKAKDGWKKTKEQEAKEEADATGKNADAAKRQSAAFRKAMSSYTLGLVGGSASAGNAISSVIGNLGTLALEGTELAIGFEVLEKTVEMVEHRFVQISKSLLSLDEVGQGFSLGLTQYTDMLYASGLKSEELNKELTQHSAATAYLGIQRTVELGNAFSKLTKMGSELFMTNEEARDAQLDYLETLRLTGDMRGKSDSQLVVSTNKYLQELNQVAEVTGMNRRELEKQINSSYNNADMQIALAGLPGAVRENMITKVLPEIAKTFGTQHTQIDNALGGYISRGLAGVGPEMTMVLNQAGAFDAFRELGDIAKAGGDTTEATRKLAKAIANPEALARLQAFAGMSGPVGDSARQLVALTQASRNALEGRNADGTLMSTEQKEAIRVQEKLKIQMNKLSASFDRLLLNLIPILIPAMDALGSGLGQVAATLHDLSKVIDLAGKGLGWVGEQLGKFGNWISKSVDEWDTKIGSPLKTIGKIFTDFIDYVKNLIGADNIKKVGAIAGRGARDIGVLGGGALLAKGIIGAGGNAIKNIAGLISNPAGEEAAQVAAKGGGKLFGKTLGRFIPGVGAALDIAGAASQAQKGNWLSAGLYGAGAATGLLATGLDSTGIGAVAGVPLGLLSGGLGLAGMMTEGKAVATPGTTTTTGPANTMDVVIKKTLEHYVAVQKANQRQIELLGQVETAVNILANVTARGHGDMISQLKKSGNQIY